MPDQPSSSHEPRPVAAVDEVTERAVLSFVLSVHPTLLTQGELTRAIASDPEDFTQRDAVVRAVVELRGAGLLHRQGAFVLPSYAALRFDQLFAG
jgi:hypothetical protein